MKLNYSSLSQFQQFVELKDYRPPTKKEYVRNVCKLAEHFRCDPATLTENQLREYFLFLRQHKHYKSSPMKAAKYALLSFYLDCVKVSGWTVFKEVRIAEPEVLPIVLARAEVHALLGAVREPRFRTALRLIYHSGLRVGEAVRIQVQDIRGRETPPRLHIRNGKGGKDRFVPIAPPMVEELRHWWRTHRNPKFLFPSPGRGWADRTFSLSQSMTHSSAPISVSSVQSPLPHSRAGRPTVPLRLWPVPLCLSLLQPSGLSAVRPRRCHPVAGTTTPPTPALPYYLVTFTVPRQLRALIRSNQKLLYDLLLRHSAGALLDVGRHHKNLRAQLGLLTVLQTWTPDLRFHPHVHCVLPAGGLSADGLRWVRPKDPAYFLPQAALAMRLRTRLKQALQQDHPQLFVQIPRPVWSIDWVADVQAVGRGQSALKYLAAYLYRTAFSAERILHDDGRFITFCYRHSRSGDTRTMRLPAECFLHRFLQHVLPQGFQRVR